MSPTTKVWPRRPRRSTPDLKNQGWGATVSDSESRSMASTLKSLRALSAPSRLRLLALLNESELTVRELTEITNMRQSGISMHLLSLIHI